MSEITRVGVDLAKNVFQVHAVDAAGRVVAARSIDRRKFMHWGAQLPAQCLVAMEACSGAHHWARRLHKELQLTIKLIAPQFVAPYRIQGRHGKNDANDAAAVCEAASRPTMKYVPIKTVQQQGTLVAHRLREGYKSDWIAWGNRIRGILAEFGVVVPKGPQRLRSELPQLLEDAENELPADVRLMLLEAMEHLDALHKLMHCSEKHIDRHAQQDPRVRQAMELWGVGPITASAVVATVGDFRQFTSAAQFGAWLGLTPSQKSSGGKDKLGSMTKAGDTYLRMLLIQGAKSALHTGKNAKGRIPDWARALSARRGWQRAAVALANKNARILWAMFTRGQPFVPDHVSIKPT